MKIPNCNAVRIKIVRCWMKNSSKIWIDLSIHLYCNIAFDGTDAEGLSDGDAAGISALLHVTLGSGSRVTLRHIRSETRLPCSRRQGRRPRSPSRHIIPARRNEWDSLALHYIMSTGAWRKKGGQAGGRRTERGKVKGRDYLLFLLSWRKVLCFWAAIACQSERANPLYQKLTVQRWVGIYPCQRCPRAAGRWHLMFVHSDICQSLSETNIPDGKAHANGNSRCSHVFGWPLCLFFASENLVALNLLHTMSCICNTNVGAVRTSRSVDLEEISMQEKSANHVSSSREIRSM
jgi:hypothetical protein